MFLKKTNNRDITDNLRPDYINVIWIAEHADVNFASLIEEANKLNVEIVGGIFPGILHDRFRYDDSAIIHYLPKTDKVFLIDHNKHEELPDLNDTYHSAYVLIDGLSDQIPQILSALYQKYWDKLTFIGGGCGSLSLKQAPCLFTNEGIYQDSSVIVLSENKIQVGVKHGWNKIAGPFLVNKSEKNVIHEINWEPAFDFYKRVVDEFSPKPLAIDSFFDVAKGYPFGVAREGTEDIVRDPLFSEDGKTITCVAAVGENTTINILQGEKSSLTTSAKAAAQIALRNISPKSIFVVDCISRVLFLEDDYEEELRLINEEMEGNKVKVPLEGVLSLGEISSYEDGLLEFLNKTVVVAATF